jgi:hypothetical protein
VTRGPPPTTPLGGWSPQVPITAREAKNGPVRPLGAPTKTKILTRKPPERGVILWIREQSEYCQDLNYNKGGAASTPKDVATCGAGVGVVHRRPDGSVVGASRGAKQAGPGSGRRGVGLFMWLT